jgi:phospholipase A1
MIGSVKFFPVSVLLLCTLLILRADAAEAFQNQDALAGGFEPMGDAVSERTFHDLLLQRFLVRPHHPNYFMFTYADSDPTGIEEDPSLYKRAEVDMRFSVRIDRASGTFLGFEQFFTLAYTHEMYWQLFASSKPIRETSYMPEVIWSLSMERNLGAAELKTLSLGYVHESNGQAGDQSLSWNRLYLDAYFQRQRLLAELKVWYTMPDPEPGDITDYYGHGMLKLSYIYKKSLSRLYLRESFKTGRGSAELEFTYPLPGGNVFLYMNAFTGYGYSLSDLQTYRNVAGFGLSISR